MCPVAAESKNSKPSSKKNINKKINSNLNKIVDKENNMLTKNEVESSDLNELSIENNDEFNDSDDENKGLSNIKLGPKGIDRIVPIGRTMEFSSVWDGYELINTLSRRIEII